MSLTYGAQSFGAQAKRSQYQRDAILSATPANLLTMLYDRLLLDLGRAEVAQQSQQWSMASENLKHAQAIVAELTASLRVELWEGGENLKAVYTYVTTALINANIQRNAGLTRECIELLEPLRSAWHEAAAQLPAQPVLETSDAGVLGVG